jgi:hypothetical protein
MSNLDELSPEEWDRLESQAELTDYQRGIIREARHNAVILQEHAKRIEHLESIIGVRTRGHADRAGGAVN